MSESRTKKSAVNATVAIGAYFFGMLLSFLTRTVFVRYMQTEYLGIGGLFTNILTVLSLAELGIGDALVFALYKPMKEQNRQQLTLLIRFARRVYHMLAVAVMVLGLVISLFLEHLIKDVPDIPESIRLIFFFYLVNSAASYLLAYKSLILVADQRQYISSLVLQGSKAVQLILQILVLVLFRNFYLYLVCQVLCTLLNNVIVHLIINKKYSWLSNKPDGTLEKSQLRQIGSDVRSLSVSKIAGVVANGTDNIIISKLIGLNAVGLASNYQMLTNAVNSILWQGLKSLLGSIGNFNVDAPVEHKQKVFDQVQLMSYWLYTVACIGITVLANPFVEGVWLGQEYVLDVPTVFALALILYVSGVNYAAYSFRVTMGVFKQIKYFHLAAGVLNLIVSVLVAPSMGLFGVFLATSVTRILTSELADGYLVCKKVLGRPFLWYLGRYLILFAVMMLDLGFTGWVVSRIPLGGLVGLLVKGICCLVCSNGVLILAFGRTEAFKALVQRVKSLVKR